MKYFFYISFILIVTSGSVTARQLPTKPYELTEYDVTSILELAKNLGIESNKPIGDISANQVIGVSERIMVNINFEPDIKKERAERFVSLHCSSINKDDWDCNIRENWWLTIKGDEGLQVLAPEDFEVDSEIYLEVLDLVTEGIGTKSQYGIISRISKNEYEFEINYGTTRGGGCMETVVIHKKIINFEAVWSIKGDYQRVVCV